MTGRTGTADLIARIDALLDDLEALRIDEVVAAFAAEGRLKLPNRPGGHPTTLRGAAEIRPFLELFARTIPAVRFVDRRYLRVEDVDVVVAEYRSEGTSRTGRPYRNRYAAFFELTDDGVALWREYFDPTAIAEALAPA